jgi:hypothetical protein
MASRFWSLAYLGKRSKFLSVNSFHDSSSKSPLVPALSSSIVFSFSLWQVRVETSCPGMRESL